jgi:hypothetical protein
MVFTGKTNTLLAKHSTTGIMAVNLNVLFAAITNDFMY